MLVAALCAGLFFWARRGQLDRGFSNDEISLYRPGSPADIVADVLTAVQPPALRVWLSDFGDVQAALEAGRLLSFGCFLLAVLAVVVVARRLGASVWLAGLVGAGLAVDPLGVELSTQVRVYAPLVFVFVAYAGCLTAWAERPGWRSAAGVALFSVLLPQLHYFLAPWLFVCGVGTALTARRRLATLALHVPAAAGFAVWLPAIRAHAADWVAPQGQLIDILHRVLPLTDRPGSTLAALAVLFAGALVSGRAGRVLAACLLGLLATVVVFGPLHYLTHQAGAYGLALTPLLVARVLAGPRAGGRLPVGLRVLGALVVLWALGQRQARAPYVLGPAARDAMQTLAADWSGLDTAGAEVVVVPTYMAQSALFHLKGRALGDEPRVAACAEERRCFVHDGVRVLGREADDLPRSRPLLVVHTGHHPLESPPQDCVLDASRAPLRLYRCLGLSREDNLR